jgi:hypothetical protein
LGDESTIDLTRGIYRRIYANFIIGRRINAVSERAEMWFWRLLSVADDFGNLIGEPSLVYAATAGRRIGRVTMEQVTTCVDELVEIGLVDRYDVGEDVYLHIRGYLQTQAAGINGKRVRRVPPWPGEGETPPDVQKRFRVNPGESRFTPVKPGGNLNCEPEPESEPKPDSKPKQKAAGAALRGDASKSTTATAGSPAAAESSVVAMTFACSGTPATWDLGQAELDRLMAEKPGVAVEAELRKLATRSRTVEGQRRSAAEMPLRVVQWLEHAQNNPKLNAATPTATPAAAAPITAKRGVSAHELTAMNNAPLTFDRDLALGALTRADFDKLVADTIAAAPEIARAALASIEPRRNEALKWKMFELLEKRRADTRVAAEVA